MIAHRYWKPSAGAFPPSEVDDVLKQTGRREKRVRKLPAAAVVWLIVLMGLRSDLDLPAMWRQVCGTLASLLLTLVGMRPPVKSALAQARRKLGCRPMRQLFRRTAQPLATGGTRGAFYKGMRLLAMDGDDYKIPDTPDNARVFGRPSTRREDEDLPGGYPVIHTMRLIEVGTRLCLEAMVKPYGTNDHEGAAPLLRAATAGDLVLWDCGFYSHGAMHQAQTEGKFFLGPAPAHAVLKPIKHLADGSYLAKVYGHSNDLRDDRGGRVVRVLEYTLDDPALVGHGERHRLVTNLLDEAAYPALELIGLYHERWEIEIANDEMTTHLLARAVELRSRTPAGVVQEYYGVLLAHNAVRMLMHEAALSIDIDPRNLSFLHAVRVIRDVLPMMRNAPSGLLPEIYRGMIASISMGLLPPRDGRINPRVVKVLRPSNFPAKKPIHSHWPQPQRPFLQSVVMLK